MLVSAEVQKQREKVFGSVIAASVLSFPVLGWLFIGLIACVMPVVILLRSAQRIQDLALLVVFVVSYYIATIACMTVLGDKWMFGGLLVWPLSFYFCRLFDKRLPTAY